MSNSEESAVFELNHDELGDDPRFAQLARVLRKCSPIDSQGSFNRYCREAIRAWRENLSDEIGKTSSEFGKLVERVEHGGDDVIQTGWGGVVVTLHQHPRVEKFLVIRRGRYLALERHEQKDERLEVKEGAGLILWRAVAGEALAVQPLKAGDKFHFTPGVEHCLIGTEDLLVFERSIDPKGMDQDLIFIYTPHDDSESEENDERSTSNIQSRMQL
jgi:hypothetical protein